MPPYVSQVELARELGVSKQAVNQGIKDGRIRPGADGKLDLPTSVERWRATSGGTGAENGLRAHRLAEGPDRPGPGEDKAQSADVPRSPGGADYHLGRAVRETYLAKLARLKYEEESGRLIDGEEAKRHFFNLARDARNSLLALADRLGPAMAPIQDAQACTDQLRAEFLKICVQLAGAGSDDSGEEQAGSQRR
jgi:hypothetical protein